MAGSPWGANGGGAELAAERLAAEACGIVEGSVPTTRHAATTIAKIAFRLFILIPPRGLRERTLSSFGEDANRICEKEIGEAGFLPTRLFRAFEAPVFVEAHTLSRRPARRPRQASVAGIIMEVDAIPAGRVSPLWAAARVQQALGGVCAIGCY